MITEYHPIASIFPMMAEEELAALAEDIKKNGLKEPVWLYENKILDGRNRAKACEILGITPETKTFTGTPEEAISHVWSMNRTRRHLNSSQAAIADAKRNKLMDAYRSVREAAKERQREHGNTAPGRPRETLPQIIAGVSEQTETRSIRATAAGTNRSYIDFADKLVNKHPEKVIEIETGGKTIPQVHRELKREELKKNPSSTIEGKYRVIYADPPWEYNDKCDIGSIQSGGCEKHYSSMSIEELCSLPIENISEDNAVLFLWATSPLLEDAFKIVRAWGFRYKASFIWDKIKHNMGHYNSVRHEFLLICTKGSCTPDEIKLFDSVQSIERSKKHSEKPEEFRAIIDTLYKHGNRIELFSRGTHPGWEVWGNES